MCCLELKAMASSSTEILLQVKTSLGRVLLTRISVRTLGTSYLYKKCKLGVCSHFVRKPPLRIFLVVG